jgi:hypothetical protein
MKLYLNDLSEYPKDCDEIGETIVCMSGHDKPKYVDPRRDVAGDLGFDTWIEHWNKPSGVLSATGGTLTQNKWYSIAVVPVDTNTVTGIDFQSGTPTLVSVPVQATGTTDKITFTIPTHPQNTTYECGTDDAGTANTLTDTTKAWTTDEWVDYLALNIETGEEFTISANTATTLTVTGHTPTSGDRFQIAKRKCTKRDIYAVEMTDADDISAGGLVYQGRVDDNTTTTWELTLFINGGTSLLYSNIPPDRYATCLSVDNRIFAGGGVVESTGLAAAITTPEDIDSYGGDDSGTATAGTATTLTDTSKTWTVNEWAGYSVINKSNGEVSNISANTADTLTIDTDISVTTNDDYVIYDDTSTSLIDVAVQTDLYDGAGSNRIVRYTFGAGITAPTNLYVGSYVTVSGSIDSDNDIEDAYVLRKADDNTWIEIVNNSGVDRTGDPEMNIDLTPNVIEGNTSGDDQTYFDEGHLYGTFRFDDEPSYTIGWIDVINQRLTLNEKYEGATVTDSAYTIETDYDLAWSDYGNPHIWRSENSTDISDKIIGIEAYRGLLLVFCRRSIWKVPLGNLYQTPQLVSDDVIISATHGIVSTPVGIMFHDGLGFSVTDGQLVRSVTQYKATDFMRGINPAMTHNIRGVYDSVNRRVEYVFAYGSDITNNYGLYITIDSLNIYPFVRLDCNAVWEDEDSDGRPVIMHGTSGRHVTDGSGTVYTHPNDQDTDGDISGGGTGGTVTEVDTTEGAKYIKVDCNAAITLGAGTICMYLPPDGGVYVPFIAKDITLDTGTVYQIDLSDDWYDDSLAVDGTVMFGVIHIDYGIRWLDFGSPQYQHKVRQVQLDIQNFTGTLHIDHYGDLDEDTALFTSTFNVTAEDTKIIAPLKKNSYYTYGFRIRGFSSTRAKILSFEVLFDTEI